MKHIGLLVVALVAACGDDHGILLLVNSSDTNVSKIRVFVGTGSPTTKDLTIEGPLTVPGATYYDRDPNDRNDVVALEGARIVRFAYATSDDIPLAIAIGYDNDSNPIAAGLARDLSAPTRSNQFNAYQIDLAGDTTVFGTAGALQVGLWSSLNAATMDPYVAECAGIQLADEATAYFVVSPDDQDCDGWKNDDPLECTPNYYDGAVLADRRNPSCLVPSGQSVAFPYCSVGGMPCTDGGGPSNGMCTATHVCVPSSVYAACNTQFSCAANMQNLVGSAVHYECTLPSDGTRLCPTTARLERPPTGGIGCSDFQIGNTTFGNAFKSNDMEVTATAGKDLSGSSCDAMIETNNGKTEGATSFTGITNFTLNNNGGVAIPIELTITSAAGGCPTPSAITCTLENDDPTATAGEDIGLTTCAAGWSPPVRVNLGLTAAPVTGGATITSDGTEMFFGAGSALAEAKRVGTSWVTGSSLVFSGLTNIRAPKLSPSGLRLMFVADAVFGSALYEITRAHLSDPFSATPIKFTDPDATVTRAIRSASYTTESTKILVSAAVGGLPPHLYLATIVTNTTVNSFAGAAFVPLAINSTVDDVHPSLSFDGLHLYFVSLRSGGAAVHVSSRATTADPFQRAVRIAEVPVDIDSYPFVTVSGDELFFTTVATSSLDVATRGPLPDN